MGDKTIWKVTRDMYIQNGTISLYYLTIMLVLHVVVAIAIPFLSRAGDVDINFWISLGFSTRIFMLILGLFAVGSYLTTFVAMGVARGKFFWGCLFSTTLLAYSLALIVSISGLIELLVFPSGAELSVGNDARAFMMNGLFYLLYYHVGWLIGLVFYNYNHWLGMLSIVGGIVALGLGERLPLGNVTESVLIPREPGSLPVLASVASVLALVLVLILVLKMLTRRVDVKV